MRKKSYFYTVLLFAAACTACARSEPEPAPDLLEGQSACGLTVDEARAFFDNQAQQSTRAAGDDRMLSAFPVSEVVPDWSDSRPSQNERLACVDVPAETGSVFRILRRQPDGTMYAVRAYGKLLVAKSLQTDSLALYMRYVVPDRLYADAYDGDLSDLFANCDARCDYSGLEIYTTLDGALVAVASYYEGELTGRVFLGDPALSATERDRRLRRLMRGVYIHPEMTVKTRMEGDWDFHGWQCFYDSTGTLYYVVNIGGENYATMDFDGVFPPCNNGQVDDSGGGGSGGGGGGSPKDPIGGDNGPGPHPGPGGPGGPDLPGGGGGSGGNGNGDGNGDNDGNDGDGENEDDFVPPPRTIIEPDPPVHRDPLNPGRYFIIDPIPYDPIIFPRPVQPEEPDEPDKPEDPDKEKPCADSLAMEANPLTKMKISDDNGGWKKNIWGKVRKNGLKFHDGIDLSGEQGRTLVYAMFSGKIVKIVSDQPLPDMDGNYPENYQNDKNPAGNRITIESELPDGRVIQVSYWHLDIKENNPYTQSLRWGMKVTAGQVIGVVGRTGNAYNMKAHLHLKTYVVGTDKKEDSVNNPFRYLYTRFDPQSGNITRDC